MHFSSKKARLLNFFLCINDEEKIVRLIPESNWAVIGFSSSSALASLSSLVSML
jgi:hypothetical protein